MMRTETTSRLVSFALAALVAITTGCGTDDGASPSRIDPGVGIESRGASLGLGATEAELRDALGDPELRLDMGAAGVRFAWPDRGVAGVLASVDDDASSAGTVVAIDLYDGFEGATPDGLALGWTADQVVATLGDEGATDPFTGAVDYPTAGLSLGYADGVVVRIRVVAATDP